MCGSLMLKALVPQQWLFSSLGCLNGKTEFIVNITSSDWVEVVANSSSGFLFVHSIPMAQGMVLFCPLLPLWPLNPLCSSAVLFFFMAKITFLCQVNLVIAPSSQGAKYLTSITLFMFKIVSFTQKLVSQNELYTSVKYPWYQILRQLPTQAKWKHISSGSNIIHNHSCSRLYCKIFFLTK